MSTKIKVFLVDDTAVVRRIVGSILEEELDIEVIGTASNGLEALDRIPRLLPDLIILDIEMPAMGGLEFLKRLRELDFKTPVLVFSSITQRGATVTVEALLLGANDYVTKPTLLGSIEAVRTHIKTMLIPRVRALCGKDYLNSANHDIGTLSYSKAQTVQSKGIDAIVIAASTGGPNALAEIISQLPIVLPVPIFIVQHMPPIFTHALAERLSRLSGLSVKECDSLAKVRPAEIWLAAGGFHMMIERTADGVFVKPDLSDPENFCRPSADVLFRSACNVYGKRVLGVVLTGMGQDGGEGCRLIHAVGGPILAQDELSSVVWGMPGFVCRERLANEVLPLKNIANAIWQYILIGRGELAAQHPSIGMMEPVEEACHDS